MKSPFNDTPFANSTERRARIKELRSLIQQESRINNPVQCAYCGQTIPAEKRLDAKYCSSSCRVDASATAGIQLNAAAWQAAQQRAARAEIAAIRFRSRADFLRRQIFPDQSTPPSVVESKPAPIPAPPVPVSAAPVRTWGAAPARDPNAPPIVFLFDDNPEDTADSFESDRLAAEAAQSPTA